MSAPLSPTPAPRAQEGDGWPEKIVVDDCLDLRGNATLRIDDGTPNGDTESCIGTIYALDEAEEIVRRWNSHAALVAALSKLEREVGMACVERNTPIIGTVTAAQWSRVESALDAARSLLARAKGGGV